MGFISYARNHEDTILWRVLSHVSPGTYVDVSCADPDQPSVTKAFHQEGWHGINVPAAGPAQSLFQQFRPLDVNLDPDAALGEAWDEHVRGPVHFLRIGPDADGRAVLSSLDLRRQRPWIVLVSGTATGGDGVQHAWEAHLLSARYALVTGDDRNRFYLADEHSELRAALARPASALDGAVSQSEHEAAGSARLLRNQRDHLLEMVVSKMGGLHAAALPHLSPYLDSPGPSLAHPGSQLCTQGQFDEPLYRRWCDVLREKPLAHRKQWEFVYILQSLWTRGILQPGKRVLGFGCGTDPIAAVIASFGCEVVATDLDPEDQRSQDWRTTEQHACGRVDILNERGICPPDLFASRVSYRNVDMNSIPEDLRGFDAVWSSCALEHIGSLRHGLDFIRNAMDCLVPGGWAIHTTEFNLSSNGPTIESANLSFFRALDLEVVASELIEEGHDVAPFNLNPGDTLPDRHLDVPPFDHASDAIHLRLRVADWAVTSIGLAVQCGGWRPVAPAEPTDAEIAAWTERIETLGQAIEETPQNPALFHELAGILDRAGEYARARQCLEVGLDQSPKSHELWDALVQHHASVGDHAGAARCAGDALGQLPVGGAGDWHLRVARSLLAKGEVLEASSMLEMGLAAFEEHVGLQRLRSALGGWIHYYPRPNRVLASASS